MRGVGRCLELYVGWLEAGLCLEHFVEDRVQGSQELGVRAEVGGDARVVARERPRPDVVIDGYVGASEAVNRLLGVAHHHDSPLPGDQLPPVLAGVGVAGQEQRELGLDGVGVLELVDQHSLEALTEVASRGLALEQQVARPEQEVIEVGLAVLLALLGLLAHKPLDVGQQSE